MIVEVLGGTASSFLLAGGYRSQVPQYTIADRSMQWPKGKLALAWEEAAHLLVRQRLSFVCCT